MRVFASRIAVLLAVLLVSGCAGLGRSTAGSSEANAATLNMELGIGYLQQGNFAVALEKLKKALEYDDRLAKAHNAIAVLYEETKDNALAEEHYRRAVELEPGFTVAKLNYGRFLCARGKLAEGESQFSAIINDPNAKLADAAYTGAGVCARLSNSLQRAEEYLRKALEQNANNPSALYEMASLYHAQGKDLQARAFLQRYHAQAGYNPASLSLGIAIEDALGGSDLRRDYARLLLTQFADSEEARRLTP